MQVVTDLRFDESIFHLSVQYLDRFLACSEIPQLQLQLLGCASLLLASKIRHCYIAESKVLATLTDNCYTPDEVCAFELVLITRLGWDVAPVLPTDVLAPLIRQAGLSHVYRLRAHCIIFLTMTTFCEYDYFLF